MKTPDEIKNGLVFCNTFNNCHNCPYDKESCGWGCKVERNADALAYIQQLEAQVSRWVSVEERLPEKDTRVAVLYRFPRSETLFSSVLDYYANDPEPHFQHTLGEGGPIVRYWMPLPEPPKEE